MPPVIQTIGLVLLGILPFGLFVWLQTADDSAESGGGPASVEQSPFDASQTIPLAFPFGEPSAEIAPIADPEIVAMAAPPSPPSSSPSPRSPVPAKTSLALALPGSRSGSAGDTAPVQRRQRQ